jgi:hypothetical protein
MPNNVNESLSLDEQLKRVEFSTFIFKINPTDKLVLGKFVGSTIRGGFGYALKKVACLIKSNKKCNLCALSETCPYFLLFESKQRNDQANLKAFEIPRPYIFDTTLNTRQVYTNNTPLYLRLTLIGSAITRFPYFFLSLQELGNTGFGYGRKNFIVEDVVQSYPVVKKLYDKREETLGKPEIGKLTNNINIDTETITIDFLTPLRIKQSGKLISSLEFRDLIKSIIHRTTFLSQHWCDTNIEFDWNNLLKESKTIKIVDSNIGWTDLQRYSSRQMSNMKIGGITGNITYKGNLKQFMPLLHLGSYLHTGKNTTFGLGKYQIIGKGVKWKKENS